jgi:hypothetical protein
MIYSRELEKNYYKCHFHCLLTIKIIDGMFDNYLSNSPTNILTDKKITDGMKYNFFIDEMLYLVMEILTK